MAETATQTAKPSFGTNKVLRTDFPVSRCRLGVVDGAIVADLK